MFDYFKGKIHSLSPTHATIDCNGIGYYFLISLYTYSFLKDKSETMLFAHQLVREDALQLYGFIEEEERTMFRDLLIVSGVGASTARIILSSLTYKEIQPVIAAGDIVALQRIKGIGLKTAQRIIIDLQDKMKKGVILNPLSTPGEHNTIKGEALSALITLGFNRASGEKAIQQALKNNQQTTSVEALIKDALSYL
jgi:Holliday junction DNA helicase RuvA